MKINEIMTSGIISIERDAPVSEAMKKMLDRRVSSLIIEKGNGKGYGIITRKDIITKIIAEGKNPKEILVKEFMSEPLHTISPDKDVEETARLMAEMDIRRFPVMQDNKIIGLVSNTDILRAETIRRLDKIAEYQKD